MGVVRDSTGKYFPSTQCQILVTYSLIPLWSRAHESSEAKPPSRAAVGTPGADRALYACAMSNPEHV